MENESTYKAYSVLPNLYISRFPATASLIPQQITHILNLSPNPNAPDPTRTYHHISTLSDIDDLTPHISTIISFISSALSSNAENKVLVHCHLGINRSAAAIVTYLCWENGWGARRAVEFLRGVKGDVRPSGLFLGQIDRWFGREGEGGEEDVLVGWRRRLEERKRGERGGGEKMDEGFDEGEEGGGV